MSSIITQTVLIVGQTVHIDGDTLSTRSGDARDSYNRKWFRPIPDPSVDVRRHTPDKRETCRNLSELALMTKFEKARMAYEKQYFSMAGRRLIRKKGVLTFGKDGTRRVREMRPETEIQESEAAGIRSGLLDEVASRASAGTGQ